MPSSSVFQIVPGEGGHWTVKDRWNQHVFPGKDFRTPNEAQGALAELAKSRGIGWDVVYNTEGRPEMVIMGGERRAESSHPVVVLRLTISPELDAILDNMAEEVHGSKGDAILKALALFKIALDAKKEGKRIGILDDELNVEQEITGF